MNDWYYREHYAPAVPKKVKGGIKAQTKRGDFGRTWWAKRWIAVLESFNIGARLSRGRSYARKGQVVSLVVEKGKVTGAVQGTRTRPYEVAIRVKALNSTEWRKIIEALSEKAIFGAKLLAGEMPEDIEVIFKEQKLSLFPKKLSDLTTECSCPDWSNPCKHIAAVYYLLGEEFDRDPFLIFKLRGMDRDELVSRIARFHAAGTKQEPRQGMDEDEELMPESISASEPLPQDPEAFWRSPTRHRSEDKEVLVPKLPAALAKRLGNFPLWRGTEPFVESLERIYAAASSMGLDVYLGSGE